MIDRMPEDIEQMLWEIDPDEVEEVVSNWYKGLGELDQYERTYPRDVEAIALGNRTFGERKKVPTIHEKMKQFLSDYKTVLQEKTEAYKDKENPQKEQVYELDEKNETSQAKETKPLMYGFKFVSDMSTPDFPEEFKEPGRDLTSEKDRESQRRKEVLEKLHHNFSAQSIDFKSPDNEKGKEGAEPDKERAEEPDLLYGFKLESFDTNYGYEDKAPEKDQIIDRDEWSPSKE